MKRRKQSCGAPSLLDSDDEESIAKAFEDKSTAHGRRHDMVPYTNHRVKKKDLLSLANYFRLKQGKKLIKSATTVLNRARPRNVRSIAANCFVPKNHLKQKMRKMFVPNIRESMCVMLN